MSLHLVVLCLSGFGVVAATTSGAVSLALPLFDRLATHLRERDRVALFFGLSVLPVAIGAFSILASFFPAWGLVRDHCLNHGPHHPHLCPDHLGSSPGLPLTVIALLVAARIVASFVQLVRSASISWKTRRALMEVSEMREGALIFPSATPEAFVVGLLRPRVFASSALFALGAPIYLPVLAHERAHAEGSDSMWRVLAALFSLGHLPHMATLLRARLIAAQEFAADERGAGPTKAGRLQMAEALIQLAKRQTSASFGLAFTDGDLKARVSVLLEPPRLGRAWPARVLLLLALALPVLIGLSHDLVHHELEIVLGALS